MMKPPDDKEMIEYLREDIERLEQRICWRDLRIRELEDLVKSLADRVAAQSELLSQRAEKPQMNDSEERVEPRVFMPDWVSPPGDTIRNILEERKISLDAFAEKMGQSVQWCQDLIAARVEIDEELANKLSIELGATQGFWLRRENRYRQDLVRLDRCSQCGGPKAHMHGGLRCPSCSNPFKR